VDPPASAREISSGQKACGTRFARARAWIAPNRTITAISTKTNSSSSCSKITLIT
jgi:hypothetical protein